MVSYILDLTTGEVRKNRFRIRLQEKPFRVLVLLAERQGQLVTREELRQRLWSNGTHVDFESGLNTAVSKLRESLCDNAGKPRYIETIPRRGYRFVAAVTAFPAPPIESPARPRISAGENGIHSIAVLPLSQEIFRLTLAWTTFPTALPKP